MRFVRLDPPPVFLGFGVLTPAGVGVAGLLDTGVSDAPVGVAVPADLAVLGGEPVQRLHRPDRYGALGCAAARVALADAGVAPPEQVDPDWGVTIGSGLGCGTSSLRHHLDRCDKPAAELSPALFVRTVSSAVGGDISMAWRLGGTSETLVSGWAAGAEAMASAGAALAEGRARFMLAGGVEAPDARVEEMHAAFRRDADLPWLPRRLSEGAAIAVMGLEGRAAGADALRLRAYGRSHDPTGRFSLAGALDALRPLRFRSTLIANGIPPGLQARWRSEAGSMEIESLPQRVGELGAAGGPVAVAVAAARRLQSVLVIARGADGCTVVLALAAGPP